MKKEEISLATKQKLAEALKDEMKHKSFDKIKISALLEKCDITRPTFYYHFQDIYELMYWTFENEMIELLKKSENCISWDEGCYLVLQYVKENEKVCLCAYESIGWEMLERLFYKDVRAVMQNFVDILAETIQANKEDIDFIADFYTRAFVSCLANWLHHGLKTSPEELIDRLDICMHGNIKAALERSADRK